MTFWEKVFPFNAFYKKKLGINGFNPSKLWIQSNFDSFDFTTKKDLQDNQQQFPPYGNFHYLNHNSYQRFHQTSGSTGKPLHFLDSKEGWDWLLDNWLKIFAMAGIDKGDRLFFPFSFGPFLGFWTAFEAASKAGFLSFPGGGMSTEARLSLIKNNKINVIFTTPSYALRVGEVAETLGYDIRALNIKKLVLAGEPGANIASTRIRLEKIWGPVVVDHHGMTETGPVSIECTENQGILHIIPMAFVPEVIDPITIKTLTVDSNGELVLSSSGRVGCPLLRYRTGDIVNLEHHNCKCGFKGYSLRGGILGRVDEMIFYKGNNIYPSALQNLMHKMDEITEFRITFKKSEIMPELLFEVETSEINYEKVQTLVESAVINLFLFKPKVNVLPVGSLPRQELKSKRFIQI